VVLALCAVLPVWVLVLPKVAVIPVTAGGGGGSGFAWLGWIWAAGFGLAVLRLVLAAWVLVHWYRRSEFIACVEGVEIRMLGHLKGPVAAGVFRKVVFVPEAWRDWPESTRRIVVDHETAHLERRDPLWRWMAEIAAAVNWYNPVVWWMVRRLSVQCEFACDSRVLLKGVSAGHYAMLLCDLAEDSSHHGPAMAMAERASLEDRVRRLMENRDPVGTMAVPLVIGLTVLAALALSLAGSKTSVGNGVSADDVGIRWAADPFPGESGGGL
jgi:hypothetical protein